MFERFTDGARMVIVAAQDEARLLNHDYVGTEHILLGVIHEGEGIAAQALRASGVDREAVRQRLEEITPPGTQPPSGHIPFTPRSKTVLELSLREALQLGDNYIGTEHLLLGLTREGDGLAAQILVRLGTDLNQVRATVLRMRADIPARQRSRVVPGGALDLAAQLADVRGRGREIVSRLDSISERLTVIERHLGPGGQPGAAAGAPPGA